MFRKILIATDLSECSDAAMHAALELAYGLGASIVVLHVDEPGYEARTWFASIAAEEVAINRTLSERAQEEARAALEAKLASVRETRYRGLPIEVRLVSGVPADTILDEAKRAGADLIVVGTHGRRGLQHALLGSIAERLVRTAPIPVLTVRGSDAPAGATRRPAGTVEEQAAGASSASARAE